jgi:DNA/RNA-binding protein KIN17
MPKAEKGSLKDLGKRIKSKGLQRLRYFCQMCEKQCRDANGFKCHLTSESHLRQMKIFSENAGSFMDRYSKEFEKTYLDTLRMRHSTSRTNANNVYQEVIQDKQHIHMNSTIWASLSDFCKYLGKTGKCVVEETERGWYVTYVEQDVTKLHQQEVAAARAAAEQAAEQATHQRMEYQRVEAAKALDRAGGVLHTQATKLERGDVEDETTTTTTIQLALHTTKTKKKLKNKAMGKSVFGNDDEDSDEDEPKQSQEQSATVATSLVPSTKANGKRPHPDQRRDTTSMGKNDALDNNTKKHSHKRAKTDGAKDADDEAVEEPWLYRGILIRIVNQQFAAGKYFRCKAAVDKVMEDGYTAQVSVVGDDDNASIAGDVLRLDQEDLETVAPKKVNEKVRIVRGKHRGEKAVAVELDKKKCRAVLELKDGTTLDHVDYDDFSRLA